MKGRAHELKKQQLPKHPKWRWLVKRWTNKHPGNSKALTDSDLNASKKKEREKKRVYWIAVLLQLMKAANPFKIQLDFLTYKQTHTKTKSLTNTLIPPLNVHRTIEALSSLIGLKSQKAGFPPPPAFRGKIAPARETHSFLDPRMYYWWFIL